MLRPCALVLVLLIASYSVASQEAVKLIELGQLSKRIANRKLVPLWKTIRCDEGVDIYVINYGAKTEGRRRAELISDSWGFRCEFTRFRGFVFIDGGQSKPRSVIWKVPIGVEPPQP